MIMSSRRHFLTAAIAAPAVLRGASTRSWVEVEKILSSSNVKGRLAKDEVPTPALMLDLDLFEANVKRMVTHARENNRALRPHGKTHKCPEIAKYIIKQGAVGACGAKLSEAEVFAAHGVRGLLVTTAVLGKHKIERAVRLASTAPDTIFCVDNAQNAQDLNDAAASAKRKLWVAIDLCVSGRTGIMPGAAAVALGEQIANLPNLQFKGIQAYAGGASHTKGWENRQKASLAAMTPAIETRAELNKRGINTAWLSGGSTGTYNIDSNIDGITELQPGSFMFMDTDYNVIGGKGTGDHYGDFGNALTILATVVSRPTDAHVIIDSGYKAMATDRSFAPVPKEPGIKFGFNGDEHGKITSTAGALKLQTGDRIEIIAPHCDPTVNLYDRIYCTRGQQVEAVWSIAARGMSQ
jgi:3-hydroxy-D-aspartate aldolase